ncbi:hypothetical protein FW800_06095 [Pseudomonas sp. 910_23]|uniref:cold-shock protein n=1 Tax=Pseudomonas sp. 910_23 TaxID=2604461 RepID=UPI00406326D3
MPSGKIKVFDPSKGYAIVVDDREQAQYDAWRTDSRDSFDSLSVNKSVTFDTQWKADEGKYVAVNVVLS